MLLQKRPEAWDRAERHVQGHVQAGERARANLPHIQPHCNSRNARTSRNLAGPLAFIVAASEHHGCCNGLQHGCCPWIQGQFFLACCSAVFQGSLGPRGLYNAAEQAARRSPFLKAPAVQNPFLLGGKIQRWIYPWLLQRYLGKSVGWPQTG